MPILLQNRIFLALSVVLLLLLSATLTLEIPLITLAGIGILLLILGILKPLHLFYALIITIPFSFEHSFGELVSTDFPDEMLMLVCLGTYMFVLTYANPDSVKAMLRHPLFLLILLQYFWGVICAFFSQEALLSAKYVLSKIWYIVPFIIVPQLLFTSKKRWMTLGLCVLMPTIIISCIALFRHSYTGFSFVSINDAVAPIFRNHVTYAASLSIGFSVLAAVYFMYPSHRKNMLMLTAMIILITAIYFSYTRGTWLSIIISLLSITLLLSKLIKSGVIAGFVLVIGFTLFMIKDNRYHILMPDYEHTIIHNNLSEHLSSMYAMKELSTSERFYRWVAAFRMSTEHPVVGFGPSTFYTQYKQYTDARFRTYVSGNPEKSTVHNYFLLTMVEQGFIGLIILISLIIYLYFQFQNLFHSLQDTFYKTIVLVLFLITTNIIVINFFSDMIETDKVGTFYFLVFGCVILLGNLNKKGLIT